MLSCEKVTDNLSAQLDGELSLRERAAMRFHQFICSDCKNAAQNFRSLVESLRDRPPIVLDATDADSNPEIPGQDGMPGDEYHDRVMQALENEGVRD